VEKWRETWRRGVAPLLPTRGLEALALALTSDDARLLQGATTSPPSLKCVWDWPVEAACLLAYPMWRLAGDYTVGDCEADFASLCFQIDEALGEPAGCRHLMNWFDDTPRDRMRRELLPEVLHVIEQRRAQDGQAVAPEHRPETEVPRE
jgi:hypothetical protein